MRCSVVALCSILTWIVAATACGDGGPTGSEGGSNSPPAGFVWNAENCPGGVAGQHLSVSIGPSNVQIEIGDTLRMSTFVSGLAPGEPGCRVYLKLEGNAALVDSATITVTGPGTIRVTALVPESSASATLEAIPATPIMPRRYRVVDVTADVGDDSVMFVRMNQRREIIGHVRGRALLWRPGGVQYLEGCARALDINGHGEVACQLNPGAGVWRDGVITAIPALSELPATTTLEMAINDSGTVAGAALASCCQLFVLNQGQLTSIADVSSALFPFRVHRLNNAGQLFASQRVAEYETAVYVIKDGRVAEKTFVGTGRVGDANDHGALVGTLLWRGGWPTAFFTPDERAQEQLGVGNANSVNNSDQVVGRVYPGGDNSNVSLRGPFYWDSATGLSRLRWSSTDPGWVITDARQIIDDGSILATADNEALGRFGHTVLLVPIP